MRLYKAVIVIGLAFGVGLLAGYLWWARDVERLRRELDSARQSTPAQPGGEKVWSVTGIVRAVLPKDGSVLITHEPIPGLMGQMTMAFRVTDRALMKEVGPGDRVQFTLVAVDKDLVLVRLRKAESP